MSLHAHHKGAVATITAAALLDAGLGTWFGIADHIGVPDGLYFATTTATTVGYGDITPHGWLPHVLACLIMIMVIPLVTATFSLFTAGLAGNGLVGAEQRIKRHVNGALRYHLKGAAGEPQD